MIDSLQSISTETAMERIARLQQEMQANGADGMLITQNIDLFYFTGSMQTGYAFVPASGDPVFYVKRSVERAMLETGIRVKELGAFRQFRQTLAGDYPELFSGGKCLRIAADLDVLPAQTYLKLAEWLAAGKGGCELVDGSASIRKLRMIKSEVEIERIEAAAQAVDEALTEALNELREGMSELAWMARIEYELRLRGHIGLMRMRGYNQEIATGMLISGAAAAMPTYFDGPAGGLGLGAASPQSVSRSLIKRNEPILLDIGCCIDGYIIDQTRTAVIGELPERLLFAYQTSEAIIRETEQQMAPGAVCSDLYVRALAQAATAGLADHFMGYGADQAKFLGHGIGLEIDEWPVLAKGFDMPLEAGMVIAVEPKFTFPGLGVVGIENSYCITNASSRPLTRTKEGIIQLP
ncbi:Xaa-Pro peptidase family protein [Paenibacillus sp. NEAU-GSW1]|uniref:M24 family metallopeptidase n=1 Tax=Paenibacillus sp. NEAU-GSW1 TaxID=2682486 RepID=UPI0012E2BE3D|nr:Xaa-Pro peptidase family protein [Paenibacillus sp. NEAU-GSW1]MUT68631.1 M24 family metallopeptidase [Paenibacillus sp. NEAU-GSW1]